MDQRSVYGNDVKALFKTLEQLESKRAELLAALTEAEAALGPAEREDTAVASRALIERTEPPEATKLAEAEAAVSKLQRDLHVNLRAAFESVEREIAMKVAEQWDSWRPAVIKTRDDKRKAAHQCLSQLSDLLAEITELKAALDWGEEPLTNTGTLKRAQPEAILLRFAAGDPVPLERVLHRLGLALSDEEQPRPGVSFAPRPPDGQAYTHVAPQHQKQPRRLTVSTQHEAQALADAKRRDERIGVAN